jgi:hypothetical protein
MPFRPTRTTPSPPIENLGPIHYKNVLQWTLVGIFKAKNHQLLTVVRVPEILPEIIVVMKSGKIYRGTPRDVYHKFRQAVIDDTFTHFFTIRDRIEIVHEPLFSTRYTAHSRYLSRFTSFDYRLYQTFRSWRISYIRQLAPTVPP